VRASVRESPHVNSPPVYFSTGAYLIHEWSGARHKAHYPQFLKSPVEEVWQ